MICRRFLIRQNPIERIFDGIKGDVAVTSDNKLVMCHDSCFVFDENGRVFDSDAVESGVQGERKNIVDMTYAECLALEHNSEAVKEHLGYYPKVIGLEDFLKICKENQKLAYITVRVLRMKEITEEIYRLLVKYDMVEQCIINSFTYETLAAMRKLDDRIFLSQVQPPDSVPTKEIVDNLVALGNTAICFAWSKEFVHEDALYNQSKAAIAYAKQKGLVTHFSQVWDKEAYSLSVKRGFVGFQCATACTIEKCGL